MSHHPLYGDAEGPLGFPMPSPQAKELDTLMRSLPTEAGYTYRKLSLPAALDDLRPGERADISWISTEAPDRDRDLVLASGMDDSHFQINPIVTLNHAYWLPPVGLSLWRRAGTDGGRRGVLAKTYYPQRPERWPDSSWPPDETLALVQAGLLRGKSIGFLPLKARPPSEEEVKQHPDMAGVRYVIEKWLLLEYACCYLPVQQYAVVEAVGKAMVPPLSASVQRALGIATPVATPVVEAARERQVPTVASLEATLRRVDWDELTRTVVRDRLDRLHGVV